MFFIDGLYFASNHLIALIGAKLYFSRHSSSICYCIKGTSFVINDSLAKKLIMLKKLVGKLCTAFCKNICQRYRYESGYNCKFAIKTHTHSINSICLTKIYILSHHIAGIRNNYESNWVEMKRDSSFEKIMQK